MTQVNLSRTLLGVLYVNILQSIISFGTWEGVLTLLLLSKEYFILSEYVLHKYV